MRRIFFIATILVFALHAKTQPYNNEWIDYSKTYYKFKVGKTGLYRINKSALPLEIANTPAEQFELWRNGKQVAIYTSVASGPLPTNGFIEFWGEQNDGVPDAALYKNAANQLSQALSLETDTAAYFLTINAGSNLRIADALNNVTGNTLPPEQYFMYDYHVDFRNKINRGFALDYGEYIYSSTYDLGEWFSTNDIQPNSPLQVNAGDLHVYAAGPNASFEISFAGNITYNPPNQRTEKVSINGVDIIKQKSDNFQAQVSTNNAVALSLLAGNATFTITDISTDANDRIVAGFMNLNYPREFDFGGAANFMFNMPASAQDKYFEIKNFTAGSTAPVLYDLSNNKRYIANTDLANVLRFVLPSSAVARKLVLVDEDATNIYLVESFEKKTFTDFSSTSNQGNYLIISNKILWTSANNYASYRQSSAGGSFNAKVFDIDELVDQFAFGIKKHPLSVKNFLRYARNNFTIKPSFALLVGKAVTYNEYRMNENSVHAEELNLVPTFGWPASDNLLASNDLNPLPATAIGRISAIRNDEVESYLAKVKVYEQQQVSTKQTIADKAWMKTMIHVTGANNAPFLENIITNDLNRYKNIIQDTFYGANVYSFNKSTVTSQSAANELMKQLFNNGISLLNYFGHSAATSLDYNLTSPDQFDNTGKYPMFLVNGCSAGNIYSFDTTRLSLITSLSENFVLAKEAGSIGFIASTHFGVESFLDFYNTGFYKSLAVSHYNDDVSANLHDAIISLLTSPLDSVTKYLHAEESVLHGDPAIKINAHTKPDFVVEEPQVIIDPTFISVADNNFNVKVYFYNIGKATGDSVHIAIKRRYPDGTTKTLVSKNIRSVRYIDSLQLTIPIVASTDKGLNELCVAIDDTQQYDELSELNNEVCKQFYIYEDELRPVYPYNFAIVNKSSIKLVASTASPVPTNPARQYAMEIDTTELFNSSFKHAQTISSVGGELEFDPGISFSDSTVYYWRVAPVPLSGAYHWNASSFIYLPASSFGYNQSHIYQHLKSAVDRIYLDSFSNVWNFDKRTSSFEIFNAIYPYYTQDADFQIQLNGETVTASACLGHSVIFNVFDPVSLKPYYNQAVPSTNGSGTYGGFMGSANPCGKKGSEYNFEFSYLDSVNRRKMNDFLNWIPTGLIITARLIFDQPFEQNPLAPEWKNDPLSNGSNLYYALKNAGFTGIDSFTYPRTWAFMYQKDITSFAPLWQLSAGLNDKINLYTNITSPDTLGFITSPVFGPANAWHSVKWRGRSLDTKPGDVATVNVIGVSASGAETILYTLSQSQQDFDISSINVAAYPFIKLSMRNADSINLTPYQLYYWRVLYDPVPEGALAPNILYSFKDSLALGETINAAIAFKNVSDVAFADSIKVNTTIYDAANVAHPLIMPKLKKLNPGDTAVVYIPIDSKIYSGLNNLFLDVNPANDQPEQYHFNNFLYKNFSVATDNYKPILDVTFDGIHILNNDIVSAQPHVLIKLKDESKYLLLNDTSLVNVQLRYPDGSTRRFYFNTDTLRFTAGTATDNTATVDFLPYLTQDGQYQLYVHGMDRTGNTAGNADYTVTFSVYNKPMISNMFNYPNPFTTSTAFVFTITGTVVPQNIRIQILTITGKIVKEITQAELGPLHIGRNITEYKWDGTDMFGQKLANGVYIYRVLTNLNGKSLDKFPTYDANGNEVNTDKYFNKGYGKMYLMR